MAMNIDLTNQTAVIFGSGRGLGEAIARQLAYAGAKVYVADLLEDNCKAVRDSLREEGYQAEAAACNVSNIDEIDQVLARAEEETGRLDIVINNAGIDCTAPFLDCTQEEIMRVLKVNQMGVNNGLQCAVRRMIKYNHGKVVSTSSFAGRRDLPHGMGFGHYGWTKAAVNYITQSAAFAGADYNINVNAVAPGIVLTKMWSDILDDAEKAGQDRETAWKNYLKQYIPLARGAQTADDIAYAVLFLCSKYADHITGQVLYVDGGASTT